MRAVSQEKVRQLTQQTRQQEQTGDVLERDLSLAREEKHLAVERVRTCEEQLSTKEKELTKERDEHCALMLEKTAQLEDNRSKLRLVELQVGWCYKHSLQHDTRVGHARKAAATQICEYACAHVARVELATQFTRFCVSWSSSLESIYVSAQKWSARLRAEHAHPKVHPRTYPPIGARACALFYAVAVRIDVDHIGRRDREYGAAASGDADDARGHSRQVERGRTHSEDRGVELVEKPARTE